MQNTWLGIALMALVIVAGVVIGIKMSKGAVQRRAVIAAFAVMALVIAAFFAVAITMSKQELAPLFAVACLVLPAAAYALVVRFSGSEKAGASNAAERSSRRAAAHARVDQRPAADIPPATPMMVPLPTRNPAEASVADADAEELPDAGALSLLPQVEPMSEPEPEPAPSRPQWEFVPEPAAPAIENAAPAIEAGASAAAAAAVERRADAAIAAAGELSDAAASSALPQAELVGVRDAGAAEKAVELVSELEPATDSELEMDLEPAIDPEPEPVPSRPQREFVPEPAAPAIENAAPAVENGAPAAATPAFEVGAPAAATPAVEASAPAAATPAFEAGAPAAATPAAAMPAVDRAPELDPCERLLEKAGAFKGRGQYAVAARLFAEAAGCAPDATTRRRAQFDELSCYVKADNAEKALALAAELHKSSVLTRVERIKLEAVARMK